MAEGARVLVVDDDEALRLLLERFLANAGYAVRVAASGQAGLEEARSWKPELILTDVMMPGMDGYALCSRLQADPELAMSPVVFLTALDSERDRAAAVAAGGVDYVTKPLSKETLLGCVEKHLGKRRDWARLTSAATGRRSEGSGRFLAELAKRLAAPAELQLKLARGGDIYAAAPDLGMSLTQMAREAASFAGLEYLPHVNADTLEIGVLPAPFCRANGLLVVSRAPDRREFVVSNPFQSDLPDLLAPYAEGKPVLLVTEPHNLARLLKRPDRESLSQLLRSDPDRVPVSDVANNILESAVFERASDIHIEPKEGDTVVRFRIDGDMRELYTVRRETGLMLITRFKALADLDVAERRKPQDGAMQTMIDGRSFIVRLATTSTPSGESLVLRLLEPWARPKPLQELGMTETQVRHMMEFARRQHGLVLIAGPTGSGKTTTIYSLLQHIDCKNRSLISIEDPVEYRIPDANQQQIDEKAGLSFEALLKSSMRQDPDILFLGEVRDPYSAKMAIDFSSTGHLTISSLHTTNATTAIFRLERLGVPRGAMADSILGVIAQKLLKTLCVHCKGWGPPTTEERAMLAPFTQDIPERVARPTGCAKCSNRGYLGREGVYEVIKFYPEISEMIRGNEPISAIRSFAQGRGDFLVTDHAIEKVRAGVFPVDDVYKLVLLEESEYRTQGTEGERRVEEPWEAPEPPGPKPEESEELIGKPLADAPAADGASILVVEDDEDTLRLLQRVLSNRGYRVTTASDGAEALLQLGRGRYDLLISDINMPNLDGLKLVEVVASKGVRTPVIFLTAQAGQDTEAKGLELGAADYIRKPVSKNVLLMRVRRALAGR
ncbi:MAG: Flp pilus assembly complex ATPase component TadA [Elusimicrobia bacterium]|nr:Flp pilus assembly complex ATPase component TadA [Elusimicrobiota bacterium]